MPSTMQAANRLQTALNEGKGAAMGCWQMIPGANVSRTLARSGVDWVLVDCEHGNIDGKSRPPFGHPAPARGMDVVLAFSAGQPGTSAAAISPTFSDCMPDAAMHEAVPAVAACGVSPIVRIPDNQGYMVKSK